MAADTELLKELKKISKLLTLSNGASIEKELEKYATTDERKIIWAMIDGKTQVETIAKSIKKTKAAVDIFLKILERADLIEERQYGVPPTRSLDYVPADWITLLPKASNSSNDTSEKQSDEEKKDE